MQIEPRPTEDLVPFAMNARTHSQEQITQIATSIEMFGFNNPVLIDKKDGIIAGHGRVMAAKQLGLEDVPTIVLGHLTKKQKRAFVLADNRIGLNSGWNNELLSLELEGLGEQGFDLTLIGFDDGELMQLDEPPQEDTLPGYGGATAMARGSAPLKLWRSKKLLKGDVLDFGSGQDQHEYFKYDAFSNPDVSALTRDYDTVMCNYVLNVQPSDHLITEIVCLVSKLVRPKGRALFAVVNTKELNGTDAAGGRDLRSAEQLFDLIRPFFADVELIERTKFFGFVCK